MSLELKIATRKSQLAVWQATCTQEMLKKLGIQASLYPVVTTGDQMQNTLLSHLHLEKQGGPLFTTGKGLFIKEIQEALFSNVAHIAVHSMKDLPVAQTRGLNVVSLLPRAGVRDVFVLSPRVMKEAGLATWSEEEKRNCPFDVLQKKLLGSSFFRKGAIGTSSARRQMHVRRHFKDSLNLQILRGNVDTRLQKVRSNEFSAIILAEAGLERLGFLDSSDIFPLPISIFIPATAQGCIAIEICEAQHEALLKPIQKLNCVETCIQVALERLALFLLEGDCHCPIGVHFREKELLMISGRKNILETQYAFAQDELRHVYNLFKENNFIYSYFFENLCSSALAITIKKHLAAQGFLTS